MDYNMERVEVVGYRERTKDGHLGGKAESGLLEKGSKHGRMQRSVCRHGQVHESGSNLVVKK